MLRGLLRDIDHYISIVRGELAVIVQHAYSLAALQAQRVIRGALERRRLSDRWWEELNYVSQPRKYLSLALHKSVNAEETLSSRALYVGSILEGLKLMSVCLRSSYAAGDFLRNRGDSARGSSDYGPSANSLYSALSGIHEVKGVNPGCSMKICCR